MTGDIVVYLRHNQGFFAIVSNIGGIALPAHSSGQGFCQVFLVLCDQDTHVL